MAKCSRRPLMGREAPTRVGYRREREFRDSDCLCLSFLKTFTNGCGYIFCQRFVTSWYSHKNKYLHKFQVWEDAVDKPSRLVKCWGKRESEPWLGGAGVPGGLQPRSPACCGQGGDGALSPGASRDGRDAPGSSTGSGLKGHHLISARTP